MGAAAAVAFAVSRSQALLLVVCILFCLLNGNAAVLGAVLVPTDVKLSASIKDTSISSFNSLNLNVVVPFKVRDYVVGFRTVLGNLRKAPDALFLRKTFDTGLEDVKLTVDADYCLKDHDVGIAAKLSSKKYAAALMLDGDIANRVKHIEVRKQAEVGGAGSKLSLLGGYHVLKKKFSFVGCVSHGSMSAAVKYDTDTEDPLVAVTQVLERFHLDVTPSLQVKSGLFGCAVTHRWLGGSFTSKVSSDRRALLEWRDESESGTWTTSAELVTPSKFDSSLLSIPTKITLTRDWKC
jgi:hypothetical protein